MAYILLLLEQQRNDVRWLIKLRESDSETKLLMMADFEADSSKRIARNYYFLGDMELKNQLEAINDKISSLMSGKNIRCA